VPRRGHFTIVREHARGGLTQVILAHDETLHRPAALKEVLPKRRADPVARQRFLNEAETTARLGQPGVVPVCALEQEDGQPYYYLGTQDAHLFLVNPVLFAKVLS
jgi:serine/threonine protein kinase